LFARRGRKAAAITAARDRKESDDGLRGKVASRFAAALLKKRTYASPEGVSLQFVSCRARQCDSKANTPVIS